MPRIDKNIVMLLSSETSPHVFDHESATIRLRASAHVENNGLAAWIGDGKILTPSLTDSLSWAEPYAHLSNLRAVGLCDLSEPGRTYGWCIEYSEHHFIRLDDAEAMVKALRRITREMQRLSERLGSPDSFGEYVTHFGLAIGCNRFAFRADKMLPNGTHYRWYDVDGMRRWIYNAHAPKLQEV